MTLFPGLYTLYCLQGDFCNTSMGWAVVGPNADAVVVTVVRKPDSPGVRQHGQSECMNRVAELQDAKDIPKTFFLAQFLAGVRVAGEGYMVPQP